VGRDKSKKLCFSIRQFSWESFKTNYEKFRKLKNGVDLTLHEDTSSKCKLTVFLSFIADKKSQRETEARPKVSCEIPCLAKLLVSFFLGNEKDEALFRGIFS